jgi:hypothetical protein
MAENVPYRLAEMIVEGFSSDMLRVDGGDDD